MYWSQIEGGKVDCKSLYSFRRELNTLIKRLAALCPTERLEAVHFYLVAIKKSRPSMYQDHEIDGSKTSATKSI